MSFSTWLRRDRLLPRLSLGVRMFHRGSAAATRWWPPLAAVLVVGVYIWVWVRPQSLDSAVVALVCITGIVAALSWVGSERIGYWAAYVVAQAAAWSGWVFLWLFLENLWFRLAALAILAVGSYWYFDSWSKRQQVISLGGEPLFSTPALVMGFLASFGFGVGAESMLVFLNTPLPKLLLVAYLPILGCFAALMVLSGWSLWHHLRALLATAFVLLQVFALVTWWPTSAYVAGFVISVTFLAMAAVLRQEAQGFVNRRGFSRELAVLAVLVIAVLATSRWF